MVEIHSTVFCRGRFRKTAKTGISWGPWHFLHFKDPIQNWIWHGNGFWKFSKIFIFTKCVVVEIYPNFKRWYLSQNGVFPDQTNSWSRTNLWTFRWGMAQVTRFVSKSPFFDLNGGHFLAFSGPYAQNLENFEIFFSKIWNTLGYLPNDGTSLGQQVFLEKIFQFEKSGLFGPLEGVRNLKWPYLGLKSISRKNFDAGHPLVPPRSRQATRMEKSGFLIIHHLNKLRISSVKSQSQVLSVLAAKYMMGITISYRLQRLFSQLFAA